MFPTSYQALRAPETEGQCVRPRGGGAFHNPHKEESEKA